MLLEYLVFKLDVDKVFVNFFVDFFWLIFRFCNLIDLLLNNLVLLGFFRLVVYMVLLIKIFFIGMNFLIMFLWLILFKRYKIFVWLVINGLIFCSIFFNCIVFVNKIIKLNCLLVGILFWLIIEILIVIFLLL